MTNTIIILKISDNRHVYLNNVAFSTQNEIALALEKIYLNNPAASVSIEADKSEYYEAIGNAIYASHRAGFSGERLRVLAKGKLVVS
ncbi:MAG: hypothetical protein RLZZ237_3599 [Pseudomonadota bacterium]